MEESSEPFTAETFNGEIDLLIQFGMRNFYHHISLPNPLLADDLLFNLLEILISLANNQISKEKASKMIQDIKSKSSSFGDFQNSLSQILDNLNNQNYQIYIWELASNIACLCQEYLNYTKSTLSIFDFPNDAYLERTIQSIQSHIQILSICKPEEAREAKPISFNLANPEIGSSFNSFAQAKVTSLPKCCICTEAATWFAFPCSHPVYCQLDYDDSLSGNFLCTNCPICDKPIEKFIKINLPK